MFTANQTRYILTLIQEGIFYTAVEVQPELLVLAVVADSQGLQEGEQLDESVDVQLHLVGFRRVREILEEFRAEVQVKELSCQLLCWQLAKEIDEFVGYERLLRAEVVQLGKLQAEDETIICY